LIIKAHFNSFLGTSAGKVVKLMRAMLDQFRVFCLNNPVSIVQPPVNDLNLSSPGRIELICDQSFPASFNEDMWMNIFAHEYGHMIGLPDEYDACPASTDRSSKALAINRFLAMCEVHGVQPPRMGAMTTSIMCKGRDVLPCHMLPALEAIRRITDEEGWRIG
jgi:hypothetical protein